MSDPFRYVKNSHLHSLKAVGHHILHAAKDKGTSTGKPMAFIETVSKPVLPQLCDVIY